MRSIIVPSKREPILSNAPLPLTANLDETPQQVNLDVEVIVQDEGVGSDI